MRPRSWPRCKLSSRRRSCDKHGGPELVKSGNLGHDLPVARVGSRADDPGRRTRRAMKITATEEYGMRCMLQLALHHGRDRLSHRIGEGPRGSRRRSRPRCCSACGGPAWSWRPADATAATRWQRPRSRSRCCASSRHSASRCSTRRSAASTAVPTRRDCSRLTDCSLRPVWAHLDALLRQLLRRRPRSPTSRPGSARTDRHLQERWPLTVPRAAGAAAPPPREEPNERLRTARFLLHRRARLDRRQGGRQGRRPRRSRPARSTPSWGPTAPASRRSPTP